MSIPKLFLLRISLVLLASALTHHAAADGDRLSVAGYLPDYRFYIDLNQTALFLDDLYLFSIQIDPSKGPNMLKDACCLSKDHYNKAQQASTYKQQLSGRPLQNWVTLGGGGRSDGFLYVSVY